MLRRVRTLLPIGIDLGALVEKEQKLGQLERRDLGWGLARTSLQVFGGYLGCEIVASSFEAALISGKVVCSGEVDPAETTRSILREALGNGFTQARPGEPKEFVATADFERPAPNLAARKALDKQLGALLPVEPPKQGAVPLWSAYRLLMSPIDALVVGTRCGVAADPPPGREAMETLGKAGRIDLIRNVLRGPNPEARVYAKRALVKLGKVSPADQATIDRLAASSVAIQTCQGCEHSSTSSAAAFRATED